MARNRRRSRSRGLQRTFEPAIKLDIKLTHSTLSKYDCKLDEEGIRRVAALELRGDELTIKSRVVRKWSSSSLILHTRLSWAC